LPREHRLGEESAFPVVPPLLERLGRCDLLAEVPLLALDLSQPGLGLLALGLRVGPLHLQTRDEGVVLDQPDPAHEPRLGLGQLRERRDDRLALSLALHPSLLVRRSVPLEVLEVLGRERVL
jgi:hypothetical protein